ncbi:MAG: sensor histidine kinase [Tepidisphaerales bacterium]
MSNTPPARPVPDPWRSLAAELSLEDDRERYRLARSVHDGLCQTLNLLSLKVGMAQRLAPAGDVKELLAEAAELIKEAGRSAQKLMCELSPPVLHVLGLLPAVLRFAEQIEASHGLKVQVHDDGQPQELDEATNVLLFRSVRELVMNAAEHAKVSSVTVDLRRQGADLVVAVDDRGVGFDAQAAQMQHTCGLPGVRAWIAYLGGNVEIRTALGNGSTITLTVPLPSTRAIPPSPCGTPV